MEYVGLEGVSVQVLTSGAKYVTVLPFKPRVDSESYHVRTCECSGGSQRKLPATCGAVAPTSSKYSLAYDHRFVVANTDKDVAAYANFSTRTKP